MMKHKIILKFLKWHKKLLYQAKRNLITQSLRNNKCSKLELVLKKDLNLYLIYFLHKNDGLALQKINFELCFWIQI